MEKSTLFKLNLQLFDGEGASGGEGSDAGNESLEGVIYGKQDNNGQTEAKPDRRAEFDKLTKGEWKKEFNDRVNTIVKSRLADEKKSQAAKNQPLMQLLSQKYGGDPNSETYMDDIMKAIQEDNSFWERGAMERGLTVEQYKQMQRLEAENAEFRALAEKQENAEKAGRLIEEGEALKQIYPSFDIEAEMENPDMIALLQSNVPLRTAFEVIHHDEILGGAMQYTAQMIQQKTINNIRSRGLRPAENGTKTAASATYKQNVSDLTNADIDEIMKRVSKGERIVF